MDLQQVEAEEMAFCMVQIVSVGKVTKWTGMAA